MADAPPTPVAFYRRLPPLTTVLLAVNLGWFIALEAAGGSTDATVLALFGAKVGGLITTGEWWRVVSSAFVHIGVMHIFINAWALWMLGGFIEHAYGARRMLAIYAGGALGGGLLSAWRSPHISAGASGAVMGLMGVALLFAYRNRYRLAPAAQRTFWLWLLPFFVLSLALSFALPLIDAWAHLGGLIGGLAVALPFGNPPSFPVTTRAREASAWGAAIVAAVLLAVPLGFAAHKAAGGVLWTLDDPRTVRDEAVGVAFDVPRGWNELGRRDADSRAFYDGVGAVLRCDVIPHGAKADRRAPEHDLDASETPAGATARDGARAGAIETRTLGAHSVVRLVVDSDEGGGLRQVRYALTRPWGVVRFVLESRRALASAYEGVVERIVAAARFDDDAPLARAWLLLSQGLGAQAVRVLEPAVADAGGALGTTSPRRAHALVALARGLALAGDRSKALELALAAGRIAGRDHAVFEAKVELLMGAGRLDETRRALRAQQGIVSGDAEALFRLSELALRFKLDAEAVTLLEDLTTTRRDSATAFNNLAWVLATAKDPAVRDPTKAERAARLAVEKTQWREPGFIDTLAEALWAAGRRDEAVQTIDRAIALRPKSQYLQKQRAKFRGEAIAKAPVPSAPGPQTDGGAR